MGQSQAFTQMSDQELIDLIAVNFKRPETGAMEAAHAELTRRSAIAFREGTDRLAGALAESTRQAGALNRLTLGLIGLTAVLLLVAVVQLILTS